jgi:RND family efflux transporter MFP subunit
MKTTIRKLAAPFIILLVAAAAMALMFMSKKTPEKKEVIDKTFLVEVSPVQKQDLNFIVKSQGTALPKVQTILSAQVNGKIVSVSSSFVPGGMFKKGDVLIQLERADYQSELKLAEAELARTEAALMEERARGKVAAQEWKSINSGVAPELGLRKPQLAKEIANVKAAEAQLERAQRNLARTSILAPYDGLVKDKQADIGQFISTGVKLATLYGTDVAEIRMPLSDHDLAFLELGAQDSTVTPVSLYAFVAGRDVIWQGVLARNEGVLDENSRVIYAIAQIDDPYLRKSAATGVQLKFGRFLQAQIIGNRGLGLVVLPRDVMRLDGTVLVVDDKNKLGIREVQIQRADESYVYISSGLASGELIATSVVPNPYNGMEVRILSGEKSQDDIESSGETAIADAGY